MIRPFSLKTKVITSRFDATRDWYRDLLRLQILEEWDEPGDKGCILGLGGSSREALLEIYAGQGAADFSGLSLQFRVADVDRFVVPDEPRFAARGPEDRPWGSRYLFLADPNGIPVVIFSGTSL
jgi:catechol 2,3-dioxygenase-like lactoylglutathione lyase family enzyme